MPKGWNQTVDLKEKMQARAKTRAGLSGEAAKTINRTAGRQQRAKIGNNLPGQRKLISAGGEPKIRRAKAEDIDQVYNNKDEVATDLGKISRPKVRQVDKIRFRRMVFALALVAVSLVVYGLFFRSASEKKAVAPASQTGRWYRVKLVDGEIFYGQIKDTAADPVAVNNVYYDYNQLKGEKKSDPTGSLRLIKRGKETYGPTGDIEIVRKQILLMEPLREDSKVLKAIKEYEK